MRSRTLPRTWPVRTPAIQHHCARPGPWRSDGRLVTSLTHDRMPLKPGEKPESAARLFSVYSGMDLDYWRQYYLLGEAEEVLRIPATALITAPYGDSVFVLEEETAEGGAAKTVAKQRFVRTGRARGDFVSIAQGLKPGEKVVPATPAIFPPLKKANADARATRLDLADRKSTRLNSSHRT